MNSYKKIFNNKTITISTIVIVLFSNIVFSVNWLYAKGTKTLNESNISEIQYELGIPEHDGMVEIYVNAKTHNFSYADFITTLDQEIDPRIRGLTYGVLLLNKIADRDLIESLAGEAWFQKQQIDNWFNQMSEINVWAKEGQLLGEEALGEASGIIGGSILMIPNLFEAGIDFKMLVKTFNNKILWNYFQERSQGVGSDEAFKTAVELGNYPVGGFVGLYFDAQENLTLKGKRVKEYIESLWAEFGEGYDSANGGLKTEFKEQYKNQLNQILFPVLEKIEQEKLPLPTWKEVETKTEHIKEKPFWQKYILDPIKSIFGKQKEIKDTLPAALVSPSAQEESKKQTSEQENSSDEEQIKNIIFSWADLANHLLEITEQDINPIYQQYTPNFRSQVPFSKFVEKIQEVIKIPSFVSKETKNFKEAQTETKNACGCFYLKENPVTLDIKCALKLSLYNSPKWEHLKNVVSFNEFWETATNEIPGLKEKMKPQDFLDITPGMKLIEKEEIVALKGICLGNVTSIKNCTIKIKEFPEGRWAEAICKITIFDQDISADENDKPDIFRKIDDKWFHVETNKDELGFNIEDLPPNTQNEIKKDEPQEQETPKEPQVTQKQTEKPQAETKTLPHKITAYVIDQYGEPFSDISFAVEDKRSCVYGIPPAASGPEFWSQKNKYGSQCLCAGFDVDITERINEIEPPDCEGPGWVGRDIVADRTKKDGWLESVALSPGTYTLKIPPGPCYEPDSNPIDRSNDIASSSYQQKISISDKGIFLDKIILKRGGHITANNPNICNGILEFKDQKGDKWDILGSSDACGDILSCEEVIASGGKFESWALEPGNYNLRLKSDYGDDAEILWQKDIRIDRADVSLEKIIETKESPEEETKTEAYITHRISGFIIDQHKEVVKDAIVWLTDIKGNEYGRVYSTQTGYFEIDTKSLAEGDYTLHIEKEDWQGLTKIPYCNPYEQKISITKKDISLGTITIKKWSKITAKIIDESGSPIESGLCSGFEVIDKEGHSTYYYPTYLSHAGGFNQYGYLETYPLADGEYTLRIKMRWNCPLGEYTIVERKVNISGNDIILGEIVIPPEQN